MKNPKWLEWSAVARPMAGQTVCGDLHVVAVREAGALLGVIDGLGHGPGAHAAAQMAANILKRNAGEPLATLVQHCHEALARTRGAVMTLAWMDARQQSVSWLGVGNVEALQLHADAGAGPPEFETVLLRSGLVGLQLPALQATMTPLAAGDVLVLATDGIVPDYGASLVPADPPQRMAEKIFAGHFKDTDDALVLVVRYRGL